MTLIQIKQEMGKEFLEGESGPVVVHCPSGVGRTGLVIGLDTLVQQIEDQGQKQEEGTQGNAARADTIDVYGCVFRIREDRGSMVTEQHFCAGTLISILINSSI